MQKVLVIHDPALGGITALVSILIMAEGRARGRDRRGGRIAAIEEIYEWDEVAREARMESASRSNIWGVAQRLEALEVENSPHRRLFKPNPLLKGGFQMMRMPTLLLVTISDGWGQEVLVHNCDSHYWESIMMIELPQVSGRSDTKGVPGLD